MVTEITSLSQFNTLRAKPLLILDFYATWCGPCKAISPVFERLSSQNKSLAIVFAKVDVDVCKDVAQACGISAMPTFQFYKKNVKVDEIRGADVQGLTSKIQYHSSAAAKANAGEGTQLGQASSTSTSGSVRSFVDLELCKAINTSPRSNLKAMLRPSFAGAGAAVDSADGPRMLLFLPFKQPVNLNSIKIILPASSSAQAPSKLHIGTNIVAPLDLNALGKAEAVQSFSLFSDDYTNGATELKLKTAKFKSIKSLALLVDSNLAGEPSRATQIGQVDLFGSKA